MSREVNPPRPSAFVKSMEDAELKQIAMARRTEWLAGCIVWNPPGNFEATGHPGKRREAGAIKAGKTTRSEVVRLLGKPPRESVHTNARGRGGRRLPRLHLGKSR